MKFEKLSRVATYFRSNSLFFVIWELKGVNEKLKVDVQALRAALDQEKQTNIKKQTDIDDLRRTMEDFHRASKNDSRHKKELGSKIASLEKQVASLVLKSLEEEFYARLVPGSPFILDA